MKYCLYLATSTLIIGLSLCNQAYADPIAFEFEVGDYQEGATLSGNLFGDDLNMDGLLTYSELSDFSVSWSGNSFVPTFSHLFANLAVDDAYPADPVVFEFRFDVIGMQLLSFSSCAGFIRGGCVRPTAFLHLGFSEFGVEDDDPDLVQFSASATYAAVSVPEPATFTLLGIGLLGMGLARRKKAA